MTDLRAIRSKRDFVATLTQPEQIACEILKERGNPSILTPSEISEIRAEVKRRVAFKWQQAA